MKSVFVFILIFVFQQVLAQDIDSAGPICAANKTTNWNQSLIIPPIMTSLTIDWNGP